MVSIKDIAKVTQGIEDAAHMQGYSAQLCNAHLDPDREISAVETFRSRRVDDLIVTCTGIPSNITTPGTMVAYQRISTAFQPASGGIAQQIVDFAARHDVDLIVLLCHGRTGVDRCIHGKVTQKVLSDWTCSTLTIRGRQHR
jgi:DNA-binding LacI/PurR family transcriptional regulator